MSLFSGAQQQALQAAVLEAFNSEDLAALCRIHLGQRLEVLVNVNRGLGAVVSSLIEVVESHGWTEEFVRSAHQERPQNTEIQRFCAEHATFVFTPRAPNYELTRNVSSGLAAVAGRLADDRSTIREILVGQAHQNLADLGIQFTRLRQYKALHDCLHNLQFKYARLIANGLEKFIEHPEEVDTLVILFEEMADELNQARLQAQSVETRGMEELWLNMGETAIRRMRSAVVSRAPDQKAAADGYGLLERILVAQPTRINELLTTVLESLALNRLRNLLVDFQNRIDSERSALEGATTALGNLTPRLNRILAVHREWQMVDNMLRLIENDFKTGAPLELCALLWSEIDNVFQPILDRDRDAAWSAELRQLRDGVDVALGTAEVKVAKAAFARLRPRAMWYFFKVDKELKELSDELDKLGKQLGVVLKECRNDGRPV